MCLTGLKHSRFSSQEDERLRQLVAQFGVNAWSIVAGLMSPRTVRQCRERWNHYLSAPTAEEPWTIEEDALLLQKIDEFGLRWARLSAFFSNRTDLSVKRRWNQISRSNRNEIRWASVRFKASQKSARRTLRAGKDTAPQHNSEIPNTSLENSIEQLWDVTWELSSI
jgi:hypothetical protein